MTAGYRAIINDVIPGWIDETLQLARSHASLQIIEQCLPVFFLHIVEAE